MYLYDLRSIPPAKGNKKHALMIMHHKENVYACYDL